MTASEIFLELAHIGPVPHGEEDLVYGHMLSEKGFLRAPGAYVIRPGAQVILTAHLDTVKGTRPRGVQTNGRFAQGIQGMLGADDKAGIALILWLSSLKREKEQDIGYALFLGEEVGCLGAKEALDAEVFFRAQAMVSLDRRGTGDIVVTQLKQPTASREVGLWLAQELGMGHTLAEGVWTDSAVFAGVVPECLNVSVGYEGAHTDHDVQDLAYLDELAQALVRVNWEQMPIVRVPMEVWRHPK